MRKKVLLSLLSVLLVLTSVPFLAYGADDNQTESVSIYLNGSGLHRRRFCSTRARTKKDRGIAGMPINVL